MAAVDLIFNRTLKTGNPVELVFGDDGGGGQVPEKTLVIAARMPGLQVRSLVHVRKDLVAAGRMPALRCSAAVRYNTDTPRPVVAEVAANAQQAQPVAQGWISGWQDTVALPAGWVSTAQDAMPLQEQFGVAWQDGQRQGVAVQGRFQQARPLPGAATQARWQEARSVRMGLQATAQDAAPVRAGWAVRFQESLRDRRRMLEVTAQDAMGLQYLFTTGAGPSVPLYRGFEGRYQQAMKPPAGKSQVKPPEPEKPGCYEQLVGGPIRLLFCRSRAASADLLFMCCKAVGPEPQPQFVIPLLPVYMQIHHLTAHLLPSLEPVVLTDVSIAAGDDSYCWSLSANGPEHLLDQLAPVGGLPQRLQVGIDGMQFVFAVTSTARSRSFDRRRVAVQGISVTAMLGYPYMPKQAWLSSSTATAQQLAVSALEFSGVGLDWQISDWQVPAGAWSFQGTPLQAVLRMADSVNAVVRSHRTAEQLIIAPRYPVLPWEWGAAVPDVQMPAAVIVTDELRPDPRAEYNAIYVAGGSVGGVLGHVVRSLSARDKLAPQIQDDLITHADAARMRGSWALAASGNKLQHSISMPVFTGGTNPGILNPGQLLEVADTDGTWRGLVRGVSVSASMPRVRQQVTVERVAA
ncbi:hypothetical protein [Comamonas thiooxydans]|uniref:Uncharacterized protein n=1 Tax=Comamonas thiooxydans TaxID=363952 RepID=A0A0E3BSJ0_9BURK|nr:hypothetical protein [Comamonas thiooxydans]KGH07168.1 hypothetical protein P608_21325 [Comamonas thiooxydans]KGH14247.1 hypothetical protein P607_23105 [Comamonas thiooxydans]KGH20180.1 hypothetical protein P606_21440 [Comamonas thiooxydans]